jgi:hypothetical protein
MAAKETPIGIALILCDLIILDATTQKRSLVGLFNSVNAKDFPAVIHKLCILASITQINGDVQLVLAAHNEHTGDQILALPVTAKSNDPNGVLDLAFEFDKFSFPKPGLYSFEVRGDDAMILSTRVNVLEA